ncbi:hypothetical protein A0H81_07275 [Grifola frondosa]|uniref:Uncharacterized protein n=1 Tax=Grifola frondosa TaxID=5627 RepID=A0A1C7M7Z8_GRIFR|nr:hypothetical protein A0H81_07275 [Grifola frondosa]
MSINPQETEVVDVLKALRRNQPSLGIAKVLAQLKEQNPSWTLSEKRLKQIMRSHGLETVAHAEQLSSTEGGRIPDWSQNGHSSPTSQSSPRPHPKGWSVAEEASYEKVKPISTEYLGSYLGPFDRSKLASGRKGYESDGSFILPDGSQSDALLHQLDYIRNSDRCYRLYGHGSYDWGVTFNADMNIMFTVMLSRATKRDDLAPSLYHMYQRLLAAARQVGVSASDLRAQMYAEYGMDPLLAAPPPPSSPAEATLRRMQEERARASFRKNKIELLKRLLATRGPEVTMSIEVDGRGMPVYREEIHGMDAVFCVPVKKSGEEWRMV